ncbi:universal stress protein [Desulfogranum japonicum]|uniref:universal stress protein n=1 Tax=Desulfogranum japonicum TaxID=231447 RepID=UPI0004125623|nr:universal stress protein [Desulfogranum japonicum]
MKPVNTILVPLAFSPFSKGILVYSARLAKALDADLIIINVINERDVETVQTITAFGYKVDEEHYVEEIEKQRIALLETMLKEIDYPEERIRFIFKVGRPADTILKLAMKEQVDMIVMGLKAKSDFMHALSGSVAEKLFRRSPITIVSYRDENLSQKLAKRIGF